MSVSSAGSCMSVSVFGEDDVPVDQALDEVFRLIQENINNAHVATRQLAMVPEQDGDFIVAAEFHLQICGFVDELNGLFKELKSVSKQIMGVCPKEHKEEYKALVEKVKKKRKTRNGFK